MGNGTNGTTSKRIPLPFSKVSCTEFDKNEFLYQNVIYARIYEVNHIKKKLVIVKVGMTERSYNNRQGEYDPIPPCFHFVARVPDEQTATEAEDRLREFTGDAILNLFNGQKLNGKRDWFSISVEWNPDSSKWIDDHGCEYEANYLYGILLLLYGYFCGVSSHVYLDGQGSDYFQPALPVFSPSEEAQL